MALMFLIAGLIFLISGGIGLFYINTSSHVEAGTALFFLGNLGFGTFLLFGLLILAFVAFFNSEFD